MEQEARFDFLLEYLLAELPAQNRPGIPEGYAERRGLLRALVNTRPPRAVSTAFLEMQDAFLQEESWQKGIVSLGDIPPCKADSRLSLWQGDITRLPVDAIVNAANSELLGCFVPGHHCVDNAIHTAAGVQLREECHAIMQRQGYREEPGKAKITKGYNLSAKYVIHTVGPQVRGALTETHKEQLAACYRACLEIAGAYELDSVAFCCVATGGFGFPKAAAANIAVQTVRQWLDAAGSELKVTFDVYTDEDLEAYQTALSQFY